MNPLPALAEHAASWRQAPLPAEVAHAARRALVDWFAALLPGCRVAVAECLSRFDDALAAPPSGSQAILAAVAARLH